ncbi:hypothetical protein AB0O22_32075 [Streptomyces sp. NPDC091204]|uniref:hypothetical protein n=1 Tax=Streptomyces sp. NPDC091204 TaxID=3155299 RepID=UPI003420B452
MKPHIIPTTTDPTNTWVRQVYVFTSKTPILGTGEHCHGPGAAYLVDHDGTVHRKNSVDETPLPPALLGDYWAAHMLRDIDIPVAVRALQARDAAVNRKDAEVDRFASEVLGLWRGGRWREPVSTALLGNWAAPLETDGGSMTPAFLDAFRTEVKALHRGLTPLWERRTGGHRLRSLDYSIGDDGMTVYDLVTGGLDLHEALTGALPDDPRIAAVLAKLTPAELAVAMAWANRRMDWAEAAATVIALAPPQFAGRDAAAVGDGIRRKLKRLGTQHAERAAEAAAWKAGRTCR